MPPGAPLFPSVFSEEEILRILCRKRVALAKARHDGEFVRNIVVRHHEGVRREPDFLQRLFPPRRHWQRPKDRRGLRGADLNKLALLQTTRRYLNGALNTDEPWLPALRSFIELIRKRALDDDSCALLSPNVHSVLKTRGQHIYRPIAQFSLEDAVLESLTARYLRQCFDEDLTDSSLAFRIGKDRPPRHHDGIRRLNAFRSSKGNGRLWVAECDIQGFFDCVHHDVARAALHRAIERCRARGVAVDTRAVSIFEAYLHAYSFTDTILRSEHAKLKERDPEGYYKWASTPLRAFYTTPEAERIGVPQGGAISCVVANLVLHDADTAVLSDPDPNREYVRYCDDMVLLHTSRRRCDEAFNRYRDALRAVKLPAHEPIDVGVYDKTFWNAKSKNPYEWSERSGAVPWLAFVGYHLHRDGHLRIRPSSLRKELHKQASKVDEVLAAMRRTADGTRPALRLARRRILFRLHQRLISMSVGRRTIGSTPDSPASMCWVAGFELLGEFPHQRGQLRLLDRNRARQMNRAMRLLSRRHQGTVRSGEPKPFVNALPFYGGPFSYRGQVPHTRSRPAPIRRRARPLVRFWKSCLRVATDVRRQIFSTLGRILRRQR